MSRGFFWNKKESENQPSSGPKIPRRYLFSKSAKIAQGLIVLQTLHVPEFFANGAYQTLLNRRVTIPKELQQPIVVPTAESPNIALGLGNSLEAGTRSDTSTTQLFATELLARGISMIPIVGAVANSISTDILSQYETKKQNIPANATVYIELWTGENDPFKNSKIAEVMKQFAKDPKSMVTNYFAVRDEVLKKFAKDFRVSVGEVLRRSGAVAITAKTISPVYRAKHLIHIGDYGKPDFSVNLEGNDWQTKFIKLALADIALGGSQVIVAEALRMRRNGVNINVIDPQRVLDSKYYTNDDQHPNKNGYLRVAQETARMYEKA